DERLARLFIRHGEDVASDLDQIRVQDAAIPLIENAAQFGGGQAEQLRKQHVRLTDELHVTVFNAVVHHLDVMPRAAWSDPLTARNVVVGPHFGRDRLKYWSHGRPRHRRTARHNTWSVPRALLTPRNARANVQQPFRFNVLRTPFSV